MIEHMNSEETIVKGLPLHLLLWLIKKDGSGYDMAKEIIKSHVWRGSHQQVYRELNKFCDAGFVKFKYVHQNGKPDKKVYSITNLGMKVLEFTAENIDESVGVLRSDRTVMVQTLNSGYFERLKVKLEATVTELKAKLLEQTCPVEGLAIEREIGIHAVEIEHCDRVMAFIEKELAQRKSQEAA